MIAPHLIVSRLPDRWLILAALLLAALGALMIRATTLDAAPPGGLSGEAWRQIVYIVAGVIAMLVMSRIDYRILQRLVLPLYAGSMVLLIVVLSVGTDQFGARRWIDLGFTTVQPSEFAKLVTMIAMAAFAAEREPGLRTIAAMIALAALPMGLVVIEPDLGSTLVIGIAAIVILGMWGVPWRMLGGLGLLGVSLLPLTFALAVPDYQRERLAVFFDPGRDPLGSGFTLRQVEIAFGSGHLTGRGFDAGVSALDGLAARTSDFALAQLGEQIGFAGIAVVLALFLLIGWRGIEVAATAPDRFGRLLAVGITTVIVMQAAMHIGVNVRLFPATGIPLPLISQGGSALIVTFAAVGILQSIAAHRLPSPGERSSGGW